MILLYELTENNLIEPERITRYQPFDKDGYPYCKCNLDELIGTGHTVILVEAGEYDLIEKINYFYDNDDKEPGFKVFGDIIGYTTFKFDTRGEKANSISFVFKHASEWNNAMNRKDISQSVNLKLINVGGEFFKKINKNHVQNSTNFYKAEEININIKTSKTFEYKQANKTKETIYLEGTYLKDNTGIYCVVFNNNISSDNIVFCIKEMYKNPNTSLLFDKIIAICITKVTSLENEE
ncbi:13338_t:CDS:2, partial [Cetraspora pellucida]